MARDRKFGLDCIRAAAILLVIAAHVLEQTVSGRTLRTLAFALAICGVEMFFVLSGYLVGGIALKHEGSFIAFWSRRWLRTLPAYYVVLMFYFASAPRLYLGHFVFIQNFTGLHGFGVSWSLVIEEWFYLLLPVLIYAAHRRKLRIDLLLGTILVGLAAIRVIYTLTFDPDLFYGIQIVTPLRFESLLGGVFLAWIRWQRHSLFDALGSPLIAVLGLSLLSAGVALFITFHWMYLAQRLLYIPLFGGGTALLLPYMASLRRFEGLAASAITTTSVLSYSLYLVHLPVLLFVFRVTEGFSILFSTVIALISCYIASRFLYFAVEQPFLRLRDRAPDGGLVIAQAPIAVGNSTRDLSCEPVGPSDDHLYTEGTPSRNK